MNYQLLKNYITTKVKAKDVYVPAMILFLIKNDGHGTKEQIARLIYIFDFKHELDYYDTIVEKFASVILEDYGIVRKEDDTYYLRTWPLKEDEVDDIIKQCSKVSNGFFSNLHDRQKEELQKASTL